MASKVWDVMNDLEQVTNKIVSAREIIDAAVESIERHEYSKAETLMSAAYEFLGYYLDEFDERFKLAWKETVVKQKEEEEFAHNLSNFSVGCGNTGYAVCSPDDNSEFCNQSWNDFWEENYYPEEYYNNVEPSATQKDIDNNIHDKKHDAMYSEKHSEDYYDYTRNDPNRKNPFENKKWVLPVEMDGPSGEYFVSFPDDLLEAAKLQEGDEVYWEDNKNGTFTLRKVTKPLGMDEC